VPARYGRNAPLALFQSPVGDGRNAQILVLLDAANARYELVSELALRQSRIRGRSDAVEKALASGLALKHSAPLTPERFNEVVRSHWGVENRLHWRLDVVMNEDQDRSRLENGPHNHAVLRHMAMNVMQKDGEKGSLRGKFKRAAWDEAYLARFLTLF
jgi:predicted transposase YbfD/YdcC